MTNSKNEVAIITGGAQGIGFSIAKRLKKNKKRPLLFKSNLNEAVEKIYLSRKKTYSEADFRVKCTFLKRQLIVDKVLNLYEKKRNKV